MSRILSVIPARVFTLFASELILLYAAYIAAAFIDPDIDEVRLFLQYDSGFLRISIVVGMILFGSFVQNLYADVRIRKILTLIQGLSMTFGAAFIGEGLIGYVAPPWIIPRKMMLSGSIMAVALMFAGRIIFDKAATGADATGRLLFIGFSPVVPQIAGHLEAHPELGLKAIGYMGDGAADKSATIPHLGALDDLERILDEYVPSSLVICREEEVRPWWAGEFLALRFGGVRVQDVGALYETLFNRKSALEIQPSRVIFAVSTKATSFEEALREVLSWTIALSLAILTVPFTLLVGLWIRLSSPGPAIRRETRTGLKGKPFQAYSFRSTTKSGEVTLIGGFLRRTGLVWFPQLLNVIRGEMAMVGPRPERPAFARRMSELIPYYPQRHSVKPGMTGWARIYRRSDHPQDSMTDLEYDLYYLENRSPLLDVFILFLTLRSVDDSDFQADALRASSVA